MSDLVLSIFPGFGLLDHAFSEEGFTVVRGPDVIWGGRIETFHPPAGRFDGICGGDPCQFHSDMSNLVRARGLEPSFPDMTPDFERVVEEARPEWFLRENVARAPDIKPAGYDVRSFQLDNCTLDAGLGDKTGNEQKRRRKWWFGVRDGECPELRQWIDFALFESPIQAAPVTGRNEGRVGGPGVDYSPPKRDLAEMLRLQGLPADWFKHQPWTMQSKRKMIGNGVSLPMGRALARAIRTYSEKEE